MLIGNLKSLGLFWTNLANNQRYEPYVHTADIREFDKRLVNEGLTFLTETLPMLGKALDSFHATYVWTCPPGFGIAREVEDEVSPSELYGPEVWDIPLFLGDAVEAALKGDSVAVDCVRQLAYVFYKLEVDYGEEKREQFLANFRKIDGDLLSVFNGVDNYRDAVISQMGRIIGRVLSDSDPLDIVPSHGGGATACRTPNWKKHHRGLIFYEKLDDAYPYSDYFFYNPTHLVDELERLENSIPQSVPRARVCLVPKDSRGPRVISCEPAEMMFIQQGIMRKLYKTIETHPLTSGQINFSDQTVNRKLACAGSKGLNVATLDLADASDRVSLELVRRVFPPRWVKALEACRSEETILPNGEVVKLNKFAPMGSSCCFPVEALCFWACAQATQQLPIPGIGLGTVAGRELAFRKADGDVHVYGDDIVCVSSSYERITRGLEIVGLKVNANKSYRQGPFRESCGGDFHRGVDVTPIRVRKVFAESRTSIVTNADLINLCIDKFGYTGARDLISVIETSQGYIYPRTELSLPATVRCCFRASNEAFFRRRFNKDLQRFEYRVLTCISESKRRQLPNWEELFRKQLGKSAFSNDVSSSWDFIPRALETKDVYAHPASLQDETELPGWYTDSHSVVTKWVWMWLG